MSAEEYFAFRDHAEKIAQKAYTRLASLFDIIVMEGAGSPVEINLKEKDIVTLHMAELASAPCILVTDIDKGGSFAWIVGTLALMTSKERQMIKGTIFNKFRGRLEILSPGLKQVTELTGIPVFGVIPYLKRLMIDYEDSVALDDLKEDLKAEAVDKSWEITISIIRLPRISNFTDFDALRVEPDVKLLIADTPETINEDDIIIIPGTKNTIEDMLFLDQMGFSAKIRDRHKAGAFIIGICGGYQMLGKVVKDPHQTESRVTETRGLGILDMETTLTEEKMTKQVKASSPVFSVDNLSGYEIHMGVTTPLSDTIMNPFIITERANTKVCLEDGGTDKDITVMGTYIHGILDNDALRRTIINMVRERKGLKPIQKVTPYKKDFAYDRLAAVMREHLNIDMIYRCMGL